MGICSNEVVSAKIMQINWKNVKIVKIEKLNDGWSESLKKWHVSTLGRPNMILWILGQYLEFTIFHDFFCNFSHFWSKNHPLWNCKSDWFETWYGGALGWPQSDLFNLWWNLHNCILGQFFPFLVKKSSTLKVQVQLIWKLVWRFLEVTLVKFVQIMVKFA